LRILFTLIFSHVESYDFTPDIVINKLINTNLKISYLTVFVEPHKIEGGGTTFNCLLVLKEGLNKKTSIRQIRNIFSELENMQLEVHGLKSPKH